MKSSNQQTALKAALFMVLAANVSWQTSKSLNLVSTQKMHVTELARVSELTTARAAVTGTRGAAPAVPATAPVIRVAPAASAVEGLKPDPAIGAALVSTKEKTETHKICSLDFSIHYIQETSGANGKPVVKAYVRQVRPARPIKVSLKLSDVTFRDIVGDPTTKAKWDDLLAANVVTFLKAEGRSCDGSDENAPGPVASDERENRDDAEDARITRGHRNCTLDEDGDALRNSDKMTCNLQRLAAIDLDRSSDDTSDRDDDRGSRGSRRRDTSSEGLREVQDALDPLKTSIRQLLLSNNSKKRADGNRLFNKVLVALGKVSRTAATSADERAMTKLISNLDKAYTLGQKVNDLAADKADKFADIDDKISELNMNAMTSINPYDRYRYQSQAKQWTDYRASEVANLSQNRDYLQLRAYEQAGLLDQAEFADFTADFNSIAQTGSTAPGGITAPNDILTGRSNIDNSRGQGAGLPTYPQIDYSRLGLQNPGVIGGAQPNVPSPYGYPQTSGYPVTTGFPQATPYGTPNSNLPMTLPANVPITQGNTGYNPTYPGYNPTYPGYNPTYSGYNPTYAGYNPSAPGYNPSYAGYNPNYRPQTAPGYFNRSLMMQPLFL